MELFNKIKEIRANALKTGDKFLHSVMTNLYSDLNPVGTNTVIPNDDAVQKVVKKHLDGVIETLGLIKGKVEADVEALKVREKEILESLRPVQLTEEALKAIIEALAPKAMKDWMAHLKSEFANQYDGKVAKTVFDVFKAQGK